MTQNNTNKYAGFAIRFLALMVESMLFLLVHSLFWLYAASNSQNTAQLVYNIILYLMLILLPLGALDNLLLAPWLITRFGANIGKFITGLRVIDKNGHYLTFKRSFFRQVIGYKFSALLFGLGFLAIIRDPDKQGWHDKAVGSRVIKINNLWPVSLLIFILTSAAFVYTTSQAIQKFSKGPAINELIQYSESLKEEKKQDNKKTDNLLDISQPSGDYNKLYKEANDLYSNKQYVQAKEKARVILENAANNDTEKIGALDLLGYSNFQLGKTAEAKKYWLQILDIDGTNAPAYEALARAEFEQKNYKKAVSYARKAVKYEPDYAPNHYSLSLALFNDYQDKEAITEVKKALELDPDNKVYKETLDKIQSGQY